MTLVPLRGGAGAQETDGGWIVDAEGEWVVTGPPADICAVVDALGRVAAKLSPSTALLRFGNAVGRYRAGPLGVLLVQSGKWTETHYDQMLEDISRRATSLPFEAGAVSALPFVRSELDSPDVLYHAFVWLRQAILGEGAPLLGALRGVVGDPHRRMTPRQRLVPAAHVSRLSARAIDEVASGVQRLFRVARGRDPLGLGAFPVEVHETIAESNVDTAENRFVLAFLRSCGAVVEGVRACTRSDGKAFAGRLRADCDAMDAVLAPIVRHRVWEGVGPMHFFPASSSVLQRRSAYREILRHHVLLRMASKALPLDAHEIEDLLEVKDVARLYELWTAFAVVEAIRHWKGRPASVSETAVNEFGASFARTLLAVWPDGTEVGYNVTFSAQGGHRGRSWSVSLRPDVTLWVPSGPSAGLHLLDAKFKLEGSLERGGTATAKSGDLHKMHAYRDAIQEARSAWVMYPGTELRAWFRDGREIRREADLPAAIDGIGAIPLVPGADEARLQAVIRRILGLGLP